MNRFLLCLIPVVIVVALLCLVYILYLNAQKKEIRNLEETLEDTKKQLEKALKSEEIRKEEYEKAEKDKQNVNNKSGADRFNAACNLMSDNKD